MAGPDGANGQSATADPGTTSDPGTTATGPDGGSGQSASQSQTTAGPGNGEESFFDPKDVIGTPLEAAYKQMQAAYSRKNSEFSQGRQKIDAYDQFMANPEKQMQQIAQQYGYSLVKGQPPSEEVSFNTWDDVTDHIGKQVRDQIMKEMDPVIGQVQDLRKQSIESIFDTKYPDWRHYESEMMDNLQKHPTLVQDPDMLYQMTVPNNVLEQRAMKAAMEKLKGQGDQLTGPSSTQQTTKDEGLSGVKSFSDAVNYARQRLKERGIKSQA